MVGLAALRLRAASSTPRTRAELAQAIVDGPAPVRVAGAGHSFSGGVVTEGTLHQPRPPRARARRRRRDGLVRVEAGIRLQAALAGAARARPGDAEPRRHRRPVARRRALHRHARHRHAASRTSPRRSSRSSWSSPTAASGRSTTASCCAPRASRSARSGVIVAVTIRCVPAFRLRDRRPAGAARRGPRARCRSAPTRTTTSSSGRSRTRTSRSCARSTSTEDPPTRPGRRGAYASDVLMDNHAFRAVSEVAKRFPSQIPRLNRFMSVGRLAARARRLVATGSSPRERLVRFEEMEYALPREHAVEARARRPGRRSSATRSASRSSCASAPATTPCSHPRTSASRRSSPCTCSARWPTSRRSATSRRRWASSAGARTGASAPS